MVRKAKIKDVPEIVHLINYYAAKNEMLGRSPIHVYNSLRDYVVVEKDNKVIGVGALHVIWKDLGEIRSLAISEDQIGKGFGRQIVEFLMREASTLELPTVFALTYKPEFFEKLNFKRIDKKDLPHKVWKDCLYCHKFPDCDEIALVRPVDEQSSE